MNTEEKPRKTRNTRTQREGGPWFARVLFVSFVYFVVCFLPGCGVRVVPDQPAAPSKCPGGDCPTCPTSLNTPAPAEIPVVNLPPGARVSNYAGGSCVHASIETLFNWQGRADMAVWWRQTYSGGETSSGLAAKMDAAGVRFAHTTSGDEAFLEWSIRTRRGCAVSWPAGHMVCLVHLDAERAGILDNNNTSRVKWVDRKSFVAEWRGCGGWAVTPVYSPAAPVPYRSDKYTSCGVEQLEAREPHKLQVASSSLAPATLQIPFFAR